GALLQTVEHDETIARGQSDIQNDQVRALLLCHGDGRETVGGVGGVEMVGAQAQIQPSPQVRIIVHNQNLWFVHVPLPDIWLSAGLEREVSSPWPRAV